MNFTGFQWSSCNVGRFPWTSVPCQRPGASHVFGMTDTRDFRASDNLGITTGNRPGDRNLWLRMASGSGHARRCGAWGPESSRQVSLGALDGPKLADASRGAARCRAFRRPSRREARRAVQRRHLAPPRSFGVGRGAQEFMRISGLMLWCDPLVLL